MTDLKKQLQDLPNPIKTLLPHGSINRLAAKHNLARQTITEMLRGQSGKDETIRTVLVSAIEIHYEAGEGLANIRELVQLPQSA